MDKAQSNGTVSAFLWPDAGKEAFYIHYLLELASIGQILWKVLIGICYCGKRSKNKCICKRLLMWNQSYNDSCIENG